MNVNGKSLTADQIEDLLVEWDLTSSKCRLKIEREFAEKGGIAGVGEDWLIFLREKLQIDDYWRTVGLL